MKMKGGVNPIYKEDGLEYWMCPKGVSFETFDAAEETIWEALARAYTLKKDGLTYDEIISTVKSVLQ